MSAVCGEWDVSIRRACGVLEFDRSTYHYRSRRPDQAGLEARIKEILDIYAAGLVDAQWAVDELKKWGYDFDSGVVERAMTEVAARARATDPFASRMEEDIAEQGGTA